MNTEKEPSPIELGVEATEKKGPENVETGIENDESSIFEVARERKEDFDGACVEDSRKALKSEISEKGKKEIGDLLTSVGEAKEATDKNDESKRGVISGVLKERYGLTLEEFLGAYKPMAFEKLFPGTMVPAMGREMAIWAIAQASGIKPTEMSLSQKVEYQGKVSADLLKVFSLIAEFIPEVAVLAIPAELLGKALDGVSGALENARTKKDATILDGVKDATLAVLPRGADGKIDQNAVAGIVGKAGEMISSQSEGGVKEIGERIAKDPDALVGAVKKLVASA